jgi:hypothetical protein
MSENDNGLTRVTVNLTPSAVSALETLGQKTGLGKTDVINRALQVYMFIDQLIEEQGRANSLTVVNADGQPERIYIL